MAPTRGIPRDTPAPGWLTGDMTANDRRPRHPARLHRGGRASHLPVRCDPTAGLAAPSARADGPDARGERGRLPRGPLRADLGKPAVEGFITDIAFVLSEIESVLKHLTRWNRPTRVPSPLVTFPARSKLVPEPLGVVLVIAPGTTRSSCSSLRPSVPSPPATPWC